MYRKERFVTDLYLQLFGPLREVGPVEQVEEQECYWEQRPRPLVYPYGQQTVRHITGHEERRKGVDATPAVLVEHWALGKVPVPGGGHQAIAADPTRGRAEEETEPAAPLAETVRSSVLLLVLLELYSDAVNVVNLEFKKSEA